MTAVTASGFTFVSWWQSRCVRGWASRPDNEHSTTATTGIQCKWSNQLNLCAFM